MLTESFVQEVAQTAGFPEGKRRMQTKETDFPHFFAECLKTEHEKYFDCPRTLLFEYQKAG